MTKSILFLLTIFISMINAQPDLHKNIDQYSEYVDKIISLSLSENKGYRLLEELVSFKNRLSGTENSLKAIKWTEELMKELKLQNVKLQKIMIPYWERGAIEEVTLKSAKLNLDKNLSIAALGGSVGTNNEQIEGKIIEVKSFDELKNFSDKIKGNIVFFNRPFDQTLVNTFSGYGKMVDQRLYGASKASEFGAIAVIVRSVTTKYDNIPHTGVVIYDDKYPLIPAVAVGLEDADFLSRSLKVDSNIIVSLRLDCKNLEERESFNIIAEIVGNEFPDEVIVVGGHFDSWDKGDGAHDDGAGCIQSIETLDLINRIGIKPKRTIRCVLFMNEESGSRGAKAYSEYADKSKELHLAAIESDRGAFTPRGFSVTASDSVIDKMNTWLPLLNKAYIEWIRPGGSGADISHINNSKALIGYVPDDQRYFDVHHSANDTYESVHPREMQLGTAAIAILTLLLSEEGL